MGQSSSAILQKQLIDLRLTSKQLARQSKKSEKSEAEQKRKLKMCIEKNDMEGAKIYGQNAIREKNMALQYLRLSSRIDAVAQRVQTALSMGQLTKSMTSVVQGMDKTLATMDVEKISKVMDKFEQQFEDLDVRTAYMGNAMDMTTAAATPDDEVNALITQVAEEHGLQVAEDLDGVGSVSKKTPAAAEKADPGTSALEARFAALNSSG